MFPLKDNIPTLRFPVVTATLIALNVIAYLFWQQGGITLGDPSSQHYICNVYEYAEIPYEVTHPGEQIGIGGCEAPTAPTWLTLLTSMFMHGGLLHLGGNMLFLWIFGNNVEDSMGPVKFVLFYLLGGLAATALQVAFNADSAVPNLGASGAVAGVLGGYLILFPRARVITVIFIVFFFTIVELPALLILGFWFVQQVLFGYLELDSAGEGGGVAYFAHVGGFAFGLLAIKLFADERKRRGQIERVGRV
ncbi:MAG TPA: rhomboid family intramembrane serine protease [Solirubrobacteraceae bacterium]|nr:rhomboid family intramembrane serine protease [Solirubrobacteraceae bacterium]